MENLELKRKLFKVTFAEVEKGKEFPNAKSKVVMAVGVLNAVGLATELLTKKEMKSMFAQEVECIEFEIDFD